MTATLAPVATTPAAGQLWTLTLDGIIQGRALIAAVKDGYALVWPVTTPREPVSAAALIVDRDHPCRRLYVWPTREVGVDLRLLGTCEGPVLTRDQILNIARGTDTNTSTSLTHATRSADYTTAVTETMVEHWTDLCFAYAPETIAS